MASERAFAAVIGASWLLVAHVQAENVNCPCDSVIPNGVGLVNLRVDSSAFDQIETTIDVVDLGATSKILSGYITQWGANCNPRDIVRQVGFAYSTNSGTNWSGGDTLPPGSSLKLADPWLGISGYDTAYYCYLEGPLGSKRLKLDWSGDWGATWHGPVVLDSLYDPDKPALATGFVPFHPDSGLLHIAYWATGPIRYGRSTDGGRSFSFEWFSNGTGPSIAVNRLGWVYVVWTHAGSPGRGVKIRMSVNGGTTFNPEVTVNAGHPAVVHQLPLKPLWVKGQGFPVVAADTSGGEFDIHDSTVYIAWAGLKYGPLETPDTASATPNYDPDIFFTKSTDAGQLWLSTPKRINNDAIGNGRDQWMPAMDVDLYGGINIVFYDSRNDWRDQMTEVYLARSIDGGESFTNFPISTVKFKPCNANGRCSGPAGNGPGFCTDGATAFIGDYISITSDSSTLYACWADNRFRRMGADSSVFQYYQAVVAPIPILDTLRGTLASSRTINGPCVLEGDVTVNPSCTLSVKKGSWLIVRADSDQTPSSYGIDADRTEIIVRPGGVLNIESTGPGRPVFTSTNKTRGSWYGIRVLNGGSIKGGIGARIEYAQVGLTIDTVTTADTLRGFNIRTCQIAGVITRSDAVAFENDTISDVPNGYGIQVDHADPSVTGVQISNCQYGIYAVASESRVRGSRIVGPGSYGIYNAQDADLPSDYDTLYVSNVSDSGYFTGAHMYAAYKAHAIVDSCRFVTDTTPGVRSAYGVKAGQSVSIKLRRSLIKGFGTAGFHSFKSKANLGKTKQNNGGSEDPGDNSVHAVPVWFYDEELGWWSIDPKRVSHTGNTSTDTLRAENNWWGSSGPQSKWFTSLVDYNPNLTTDPGLGKIAPGALVSESHALPRDFTLGQNYPNPFNGTTVIEYEIHVAGKVRLSIFNVLGQLVRSLVDESQDAGRHRAEWNGRDERGRELASGVYFYRMQSERQVNSKKMVLLK